MKKRIFTLLLCLALTAALVPTAFAADSAQIEAANELYTLGVLRGTDAGFELDKETTRQEAVTMLIRLLGREQAALSATWAHPFKDVEVWCDDYVGYGYQKGLVKGISAAKFGADDTVTDAQYLTFVLRALGYSDAKGDFSCGSPWNIAEKLGLIAAGEKHTQAEPCTRGMMALISCNALDAKFKSGSQTLREHLKAAENAAAPALTSTQIARKCAGAVFYLAGYYDLDCEAQSGSGSGFFITPDGVAVTNYHTLKGNMSARVTLISGLVFPVEGIIGAKEDRDVALIRVSKTAVSGETVDSFPTVELGRSAMCQEGDRVYAIGSPVGQSNTMTDGIISNISRSVNGSLPYIQTSAATAKGSSGGALINDRGQAVGITTAVFASGDDMTLAVPIDYLMTMTREGPAIGLDYYKNVCDGVQQDTDCTLKAGSGVLNIAAGQVAAVLITTDCESEVMLASDVSDESIVYAGFGQQASTNSVMLFVAGLKAGTATVTVRFLSGYGNPNAKATVMVNVK